MAKMIYRTEQKYRRPEAMGLLALFSGLLIYKVVASAFASGGLETTEMLVLGGLFCLGWLVVLSFKMGVSISSKSLKVKYNTIFSSRSKFSKKDIEFVEFVEIPEVDMWNGMTVHFEGAYKAHGLGDNSGMKIRMKDGDDVYIYSNGIFEDRINLTEKLKAAGWSVR